MGNGKSDCTRTVLRDLLTRSPRLFFTLIPRSCKYDGKCNISFACEVLPGDEEERGETEIKLAGLAKGVPDVRPARSRDRGL